MGEEYFIMLTISDIQNLKSKKAVTQFQVPVFLLRIYCKSFSYKRICAHLLNNIL